MEIQKDRLWPAGSLYLYVTRNTSGGFHWCHSQDGCCEINEHNSSHSFQAGLAGIEECTHCASSPGDRAHLWVRGRAGFANLYFCIWYFSFCNKAEVSAVPLLCGQSSWWWMTIRGFWLWEQNHRETQLNTFHNTMSTMTGVYAVLHENPEKFKVHSVNF